MLLDTDHKSKFLYRLFVWKDFPDNIAFLLVRLYGLQVNLSQESIGRVTRTWFRKTETGKYTFDLIISLNESASEVLEEVLRTGIDKLEVKFPEDPQEINISLKKREQMTWQD